MRGGDTDEILRDFIDTTGVTFPVVRDRDGYSLFARSASGGMIAPFPLDVLIDADGRVVSIRGEYQPDLLRSEIEQILP